LQDTLALIEESESFEAIADESTNAIAHEAEEIDEFAFEDDLIEDMEAITADEGEETSTASDRSAKRHSIAPEIILDSPMPAPRKKGSPIGMFLSVIGGGFAAIPISILLMWYAMGIDPLEVGPSVAAVAPWIVPSEFHGSQLTPARRIPKIPEVRIESLASNEPVVLPPSDDAMVENPNSEGLVVTTPADSSVDANMPPPSSQSPDEILDSSIFAIKDREPSIAINPSTTVAMKPDESGDLVPKIDLKDPEPSEVKKEPEVPKSVDDAFSSLSVPTVTENEAQDVALREALTKIEMAAADLASEVSVVELIDSIKGFSTIFATIPAADPRLSIWRNQAQPVLGSINGDDFKKFSKADSQRDPSVKPEVGWIGSDFILVQSAEKQASGDVLVQSKRRRRPSLDAFPIVAPSPSEFQAQENDTYWIIGIVEDSTTLGKPIYRVLMSIKK
jgi:hypothetical protein